MSTIKLGAMLIPAPCIEHLLCAWAYSSHSPGVSLVIPHPDPRDRDSLGSLGPASTMPLPSSPQGAAEVQTADLILRLLMVKRMDKHGRVMGQDRLTKP